MKLTDVLKDIAISQAEAYRSSMEEGASAERRKIDVILAAYHRALQDPNFKCPTYLHAAITECALVEAHQRCVAEVLNGPDFNTERNLHANTLAERYDSAQERLQGAAANLYEFLTIDELGRSISITGKVEAVEKLSSLMKDLEGALLNAKVGE